MANFNLEMTGAQVKDALNQLEDRVAEGWAVGTFNGAPVTSGSPYFNNNAKHYAALAQSSVPDNTNSAVLWNVDQTGLLTDADKQQARLNIGAGAATDIANLQNRVTTTETDINVLDSRMDEFASLPSGSTSGDAELIDIRVAADGTTYTTAGDAVRGQVGNIKEELNIFDELLTTTTGDWLQGGLSPSTGAGVSSNSYLRSSQFYTYKQVKRIKSTDSSTYHFSVFVYDKNHNYIGIVDTTGTKVDTGVNSIRELSYCDLVYIERLYPSMTFKVEVYYINRSTITRDVGPSLAYLYQSTNYKVNEIKENEVQSLINWEYGDASITSAGIRYLGLRDALYNYRVRTSIGTTVHLNVGDTIQIPNGKRAYFGWTNTSNVFKALTAWRNGPQTYVVQEEGEYVFLLSYTTQSEITDISAFVSDYIIKVKGQNVSTILAASESHGNVPSYFISPLSTIISTKKTRELTCDGSGDSFIFITDVHWQQNMQNSPALISEVLKNTNTKKVVFGGDILNLGSTVDYGVTMERKFYNALSEFGIAPISVIGNHDWNDNVFATYPNAHLSNLNVYSLMFKQQESEVSDLPKITGTDYTNSFYCYTDNASQKIRYLFINNAKGSIGTTQTDWIEQRITELPVGWTVVAFAHIYWDGISNNTPTISTVGAELKSLLDTISSTANAKIAALIVGHCHFDYSEQSSAGYWIISTTTDCLGVSTLALSPTMTAGTSTEQAFDIYTIDTTNNTIYADRLGAGTSRSFVYN